MITSFRGMYQFLSNFHLCCFEWQGVTFYSSESAYQGAKSGKVEDLEKFAKYPPRVAKREGKLIKPCDNWGSIKLDVMYDILYEKFTQNGDLKEKLLRTAGEEIVECNTWGDRYWGVFKGEGQNHLGKLLMELREELQNE